MRNSGSSATGNSFYVFKFWTYAPKQPNYTLLLIHPLYALIFCYMRTILKWIFGYGWVVLDCVCRTAKYFKDFLSICFAQCFFYYEFTSFSFFLWSIDNWDGFTLRKVLWISMCEQHAILLQCRNMQYLHCLDLAWEKIPYFLIQG